MKLKRSMGSSGENHGDHRDGGLRLPDFQSEKKERISAQVISPPAGSLDAIPSLLFAPGCFAGSRSTSFRVNISSSAFCKTDPGNSSTGLSPTNFSSVIVYLEVVKVKLKCRSSDVVRSQASSIGLYVYTCCSSLKLRARRHSSCFDTLVLPTNSITIKTVSKPFSYVSIAFFGIVGGYYERAVTV